MRSQLCVSVRVYKLQMTCQDCRHSSELRVDPIGQLNLPIDGCSNVKESLHAFFAPETIEGYRSVDFDRVSDRGRFESKPSLQEQQFQKRSHITWH